MLITRMHRLIVLGLLLLAAPAWAQQGILSYLQAPMVFRNAGQTGPATTSTMTLSSLASGTGRISTQQDRLAGVGPNGARADKLCWRCTFVLTGGSPLPGETLDLFLVTNDQGRQDGQLGGTDVAITAANVHRTFGMRMLGRFIVNGETANVPMHQSSCNETESFPERLVSLVVVNNTSLSTSATVSDNVCIVSPKVLEVQAAP